MGCQDSVLGLQICSQILSRPQNRRPVTTGLVRLAVCEECFGSTTYGLLSQYFWTWTIPPWVFHEVSVLWKCAFLVGPGVW